MTDSEIIKALECCTTNGATCKDCPAFVKVDRSNCKKYFRGALDLINRQKAEIERLQELVNDMGDYFPACINCEGKTEFGERTDECVYLIDNTNYCTKRGITNIVAIQKENRSLKEELKTAKAEAYRECMARVEDRLSHKLSPELLKYIHDDLQDELNKMVGGNDGNA